ncbi:stromelysin-2-like [Antedon mediterranea]|uniref:stromelysin-2-like n=1 Tax=Antedon mediterranea TaxID=105859 RepID=UPI003AF7F17B
MLRKLYIVCSSCHYVYILSAFSILTVVEGTPVTNAGEAAEHLIKYEYLEEPDPGANTDISAFVEALKKYQATGNIPQTGELDDPTLTLMNTPRCGLSDKTDTSSSGRSKRYSLHSTKWDRKHLTWNILRYTVKVTPSQLDDAIETALKYWSDVSGLTFERKYIEDPDIIVLFAEPYDDHGDGIVFQGKGQVLAHAFYPGSGIWSGDAHFDNSETWTVGVTTGTNIVSVATHEFGHSIGLAHSNLFNSIMWPWNKAYNAHLELDQDDINGAQELYGAPTIWYPPTDSYQPTERTKKLTEAPTVTKPFIPSNCQVEFDTITVGADGGTYIFKGRYYWQMIDRKVYIPKLIDSTWPHLAANLDAAVTVKNSYIWKDRVAKTYFFKGRQVYRYTLYNLDMGFPRDISTEFGGFPYDVAKLDAVVEGIGNGQTYFFTGDRFYIYDYSEQISGPFSIGSFKGIPPSIVAGVQWTDNYLYFFSSYGWYYQFSPWNFNVNYGYPRLTVQDWFGCGLGIQAGETQPTAAAIPNNNLAIDNSSPRKTIHFLTLFISFLLFIIINYTN